MFWLKKINESLEKGIFPNDLKYAQQRTKITVSILFNVSKIYITYVCNNKLMSTLNLFYQNLKETLDKDIVRNTAF